MFKKDVIPPLGRLAVHEITRHHLLEVVGRIEKRGSLSVAEKVRTWFRQLFGYAMVIVPNMENNPARDLHVVAVPLPPAQFDLERGLWIIPAAPLKQRMMLTRKQRKRVNDIPPYIVPLSIHAQEIAKRLLNDFKPAQKCLFPGARGLTDRMSENTVNFALKSMGFDGRLTGHGLRATMSTALNEIGYPDRPRAGKRTLGRIRGNLSN